MITNLKMRPSSTATSDVDVLHLMFGALGGQLGVVRGLAEVCSRVGLRSAAISYTPPGEHLRDASVWQSFEEVRFVDKCSRIDLSGSRSIGRAMRELRPRALLLHSPYAPIVTMRARRTGTFSTAVLIEHTPPDVRTYGDDLRSALALISVDGVVLLTEDYGEQLRIRSLLRRSRLPVRVVANGVDVGRYRPPRTDGSDRPAVIGMAARLNPLKDTATLLSAVAELQRRGTGVELRIAGDGPSRPQLEQQAADLGIIGNVRFDGMLSEPELADWLRGLDLYVHASHGETMSTSVLQALATGLPCVLSDAPGLSGFAAGPRGEGAVLAPPRQPGAMADAIAQLLADPTRSRVMGERNRARALEEHSLEVMTCGYLMLLADIDPDGPWSEAIERLEG